MPRAVAHGSATEATLAVQMPSGIAGNTKMPAMSTSQDAGTPDLLFVLLPDSGLAPDGPDTLAPLAAALHAQYPNAVTLTLHPPLRDAQGRCRWWVGDAPSVEGVEAALPPMIGRLRQEAARLGLAGSASRWPAWATAHCWRWRRCRPSRPWSAGCWPLPAGYLSRPEHAPQDVCVHLLHGLADQRFPYRHLVDAAQSLVDLAPT